MSAKVFLSPARIKEIKSEIKEMTSMIRGDSDSHEGAGVGFSSHSADHIGDKGEIIKEINKNKKLLKDHTPFKLSPKQRDKANKFMKQRKKWIQEHQPSYQTHRTFYPKGSGTAKSETNFEMAIQEQMNWQKKSPQIVKEYRYLARLLDPKNPNAGNIEILRRGQ
jgi:hypothetical protein